MYDALCEEYEGETKTRLLNRGSFSVAHAYAAEINSFHASTYD
jgi:hypothetical protein